jgi:hypothetical protein
MTEFLVEVRPGREVVYRSTWALREAMRSGEISADSRIFHRVTSQWISITQHPEYRRFLTDAEPAWLQPADAGEPGPAGETAGPPRPPRWTGLSQRLAGLAHRISAAWAGWKQRLAAPSPPPGSRPPAARSKASGQTPPPPPAGDVPRPPDSSPQRDRWTYFP